jgi:hypothetical protein
MILNDLFHNKYDVSEVLYKDSSFDIVLVKNMVAMGNSFPRNYKLS